MKLRTLLIPLVLATTLFAATEPYPNLIFSPDGHYDIGSLTGRNAGRPGNIYAQTSLEAGGTSSAPASGFLQLFGKTSGSFKILPADATAKVITLSIAAQTSADATITIPDQAGTSRTLMLGTTAGNTFLQTPTSANLAALLTNETGTGLAVFGTNAALTTPTITTPVISTGLSASGSASNDFSGSTGTFKTSTGAVTIGGPATFPAGTATAGTAPVYYQSGTLLTAAAAGAVEYDGAAEYFTGNTTEGRAFRPDEQYFRLTAAGSTISTIANYFGTTSNISLVSGGFYEIDIYAWFLNTTSGTVVWTLTNSAAPTSQNIYYEMSPITGIVAPPGTATMLVGQVRNDATAALALSATGNLSDATSQYMHMHIWLQNNTGTSLKIQATKSAGSITPGVGSYWTCKRLPAASTGTFSN